MNLDRRLLRLAKMILSPLVTAIVLGVLANLAMILQAMLLSHILNAAFLEGKWLSEMHHAIIALIVVIFVRASLVLGADLFAASGAIAIKEYLRNRILKAIFSVGPAGIRDQRSGELATLVTHAVEALDAYFSQYLPQLILAVLIPLTILLVVFPIDLISGIVLFITAPLIPVFMILIGKAAEMLTRRQFNALQRMSAHFLDVLQGMAMLKALNQSKNMAKDIADNSRQYRQATMEVLRTTFLSSLTLELVATLSTAVVAVQIGLRVLYLGMTFEQAFFILLLAPEFYFPLRQLGLRFHAASSGASAAKRIFEIIDLQLMSQNKTCDNTIEDIETVEFKKVTYLYPQTYSSTGQGSGLEDINLSLRMGQRVALMGPSGAGKTTLSYLLLRFMTPQTGQILVNEIPLSTIALVEWRKKIAWVPQTPHLFMGTLAENISLGNPEASIDQIKTAAIEALLEEWIDSLPDGLQTRVGEGGIGVSGGQLQRIAIARAILKKAQIMIFDEPASHLDVDLEVRFEHVVNRLCKNRLVLVIAHRRKTVLESDLVCVLDRGRIKQMGKPSELVQVPGLFASYIKVAQEPN